MTDRGGPQLGLEDWQRIYGRARKLGPTLGLGVAVICGIFAAASPALRPMMIGTAIIWFLLLGVLVPLMVRQEVLKARRRRIDAAGRPPGPSRPKG